MDQVSKKDRMMHFLIGAFTAIIVFLMFCYFYHATNRLTLVTLAISIIIGIGFGFLAFLSGLNYPESF